MTDSINSSSESLQVKRQDAFKALGEHKSELSEVEKKAAALFEKLVNSEDLSVTINSDPSMFVRRKCKVVHLRNEK